MASHTYLRVGGTKDHSRNLPSDKSFFSDVPSDLFSVISSNEPRALGDSLVSQHANDKPASGPAYCDLSGPPARQSTQVTDPVPSSYCSAGCCEPKSPAQQSEASPDVTSVEDHITGQRNLLESLGQSKELGEMPATPQSDTFPPALGSDTGLAGCSSGCCAPKATQNDSPKRTVAVESCCEIGIDATLAACSCCVTDILQRVVRAPSSMELTLDPLEKYAETLRRCCAVLDNCCRRMCCFVNPPPSIISTRAPRLLRACEVVGNEDTEPNLLISPKCGPTAKPGSTALHLEIRGMDCADCVPKVARVLGRLPSVTAIETDYFSGRAQLRYHPETISPSTITAYLARATGFGIKEIMGADPETSSHLRITVSFPGPPPAAIANKYDVSRAEPRGVWSISFRVTGEKALLPRDVLAELEEHGGQLYTESVEQTNDPASRDLRDLIVRTALCVTCTVPVLVLAWAPLPHSPALYGGLSVGLATTVQFLAAPMYSSTARSVLFIRQVDLNVLAAVSTLISYIFSVVAYAFDVAGKPFSVPFFETCTLLVTLIYSGRTVQCATRKSAGSAINALRTLQTKGVRLIENGTVRSIDSRLLHYGDTIEILAHTRIVTDGVVLSGSSDVDESSVTGESAAVSKIPGNLVVAGTINLDGTLRVQVTKLLHENSLSKISQLVQRAQSSRAPLQDLADRLSAVILPLAVAVAGLAFLTWTLVGVVAKKRPKHEAALDGAMYAIAIVVVSCPCAIGLAVPMVTAVSMHKLARSGILVRSADLLHRTQRVSVVAFDKTGTLSRGCFTVVRSEILVKGAEPVIYGLVKDSDHPIAQGVRRFLNHRSDGMVPGNISELSTVPGKGIRAALCGFELLGGSPSFSGIDSHATVREYVSSGLSLFTVTLGGTCLAAFGLSDLPRPEARSLVRSLQRMGKKVIILSGDNRAAVSRFAADVDVDVANVHASCSPKDKQDFIRSLQARHETVLFVGDGTNDGPALATADASLAVVSGSDVAHTSASAILLGPNIHQGIVLLLRVARAADLRTRMSLLWCAAYMVGAMVLASGAAVRFRIEPRWAGLGEVVSVLPVVLIGLSMRWVVLTGAGTHLN